MSYICICFKIGFTIAALNIARPPGHIEELTTYMALRYVDILALNENAVLTIRCQAGN